jgi:hypothetical protein
VTPCPVHSRIATRASCARHPEWHNWHTGAGANRTHLGGGLPLPHSRRGHGLLYRPLSAASLARALQLHFAIKRKVTGHRRGWQASSRLPAFPSS